jgi:hypothetical protein
VAAAPPRGTQAVKGGRLVEGNISDIGNINPVSASG